MPQRIEVAMKPGLPDPAGISTKARIHEDLGIDVADVRVVDVFTVDGPLSLSQIERARTELFTDPVIQDSAVDRPMITDCDFLIEVGFRPGVTENVGKTSSEGIADTIGMAAHDEIHA